MTKCFTIVIDEQDMPAVLSGLRLLAHTEQAAIDEGRAMRMKPGAIPQVERIFADIVKQRDNQMAEGVYLRRKIGDLTDNEWLSIGAMQRTT